MAKLTDPASPDEASSLDAHIGNKIRQRRLMLDLTQEKLAKMVGLTFQQVQKYERGTNRIAVGRLVDLSRALNVSCTYFLNDLPATAIQNLGMAEQGQAPLDDAPPEVDYGSRETADLLRAYYRIEDPIKRRRVLDLLRAMREEGAA